MIKLQLINNEIVFPDSAIVTETPVVFEVDFSSILDATLYEWYVSFGNSIRHKLVGNTFEVPLVYLSRQNLSITVAGYSRSKTAAKSFTVDNIVVKRAILFGSPVDELYPEKIKQLQLQIDKLTEALAKKITEGEIF